jgi:hypothetical protein
LTITIQPAPFALALPLILFTTGIAYLIAARTCVARKPRSGLALAQFGAGREIGAASRRGATFVLPVGWSVVATRMKAMRGRHQSPFRDEPISDLHFTCGDQIVEERETLGRKL